MGVWIYVWVINSIPWIDVSVFVPISGFEVGNGKAWKSSFGVQDCFIYFVCLCVCFHMKLKSLLSRFVENCI